MSEHIPDRRLLSHIDRELGDREVEELQRHLDSCESCRARRAEIESTMALLSSAHRASLNERLPDIGNSRERLRSRLVGRRWQPWAASAASILFAVGIYYQAKDATAVRPLTPNARLTPGATVPLGREHVCAMDSDEPKPIAAAVALQVFEHYGIRNPQPRAYELDYLITPGLGGSDDIRNLWPQPYSTGIWNARVKDALEDRLRQLVCEGKMDLAAAQQEIARDWVAAYKKHFQTEHPLVSHLSFQKDRPWGD